MNAPANVLIALCAGRAVEYPLPAEGVISIGASPECPVRLQDAGFADCEANLYLGGEIDVACVAGGVAASLRGQPLPPGQRVRIRPGDVLTLGNAQIVFQRRGFRRR